MVSVAEQDGQNRLYCVLEVFNKACENPRKVSSSSFCGKLALGAVSVMGKWTPPSKTSAGLESAMIGICFSTNSLLPFERLLGLC